MKKKFLGVTLIVTLAVVAAFNINLNKSNAKGELALANLEALAYGESSVPSDYGYQCFKTISSDGTGALFTKDYCSLTNVGNYKCDSRDVRQYSNEGICIN